MRTENTWSGSRAKLERSTCLSALSRFTSFFCHSRHAQTVYSGSRAHRSFQRLHWTDQARRQGLSLGAWGACRRQRLFCTVSASAGLSTIAPQEAQEYWRKVLEGVDRPVARSMMANLDLRHLLGIPTACTRGRGRKAPLLPFYEKHKALHPTKVLLVRVGEFYEAMGTDAVVLVQWAGLNPMGSTHMPPRAGCPHTNIRRTLQSLVEEANLSVVVCEEMPEAKAYGFRAKGKVRFLSGVVTPAQPHYLYGLLDANVDPPLGRAPPILGIAASAGGYQVIEVQADVRLCTVTEGLTEDAVSARLFQGGLAPPLYIHSNTQGGIQGRLSEASPETEWEQRVTQLFRSQSGTWKRYSAMEPVEGLLQQVRRDLSLSADIEFTRIATRPGTRPKPLYYSTASQLGLHKTRGIPNLLDFVLPRTAPHACRAWLRRMLLIPPSPTVGAAVWKACKFFSETEVPLPRWVIMEASGVALKLRSEQATRAFFVDLAGLLSAVAHACASSDFRGCMDWLLEPALAEMGYPVTTPALEKACREALAEIDALVDTTAVDTEPSELEDPIFSSGNGAAGGAEGGMEALGPFFSANEGFRGQIRREVLKAANKQVEEVGSRVEAELGRILGVANDHAALSLSSPGSRAVAVYDPINNGVWVKIKGRSGKNVSVEKTIKALGLLHPCDRNGAVLKDRMSTAELDASLEAYRQACAHTAEQVQAQLKALARRLMESLPQLVCACTVSIIGAALDQHVRCATERGWGHPVQLPRAIDPAMPRHPLQIQGMWPYWLDGVGPSTVRNSLNLDSMVLLTGPNMAGKSTIMRSMIALALLARCGLFGPAASARVPYIDAFMLRTFSADAPTEGRSSFAVEMVEMRYVMDDAGRDALVLLDELGKGTEVAAGTALAAAFLERLARSGCRGVFATHLHMLLDIPLEAPGLARMKMETRAVDDPVTGRQRLEPAWHIAPGECRDSLALEVAASCRLPEDILARASIFYQDIRSHSNPSLLRPADSCGSQSRNSLNRSHGSLASGVEADDSGANGVSEEAGRQNATRAALSSRVGPSIESAADVLRSAASAMLAKLQPSNLPPEGEEGQGSVCSCQSTLPGSMYDIGMLAQDVTVQVMPAGTAPPPSSTDRSCVYVIKRSDGMFYCGQSDRLADRLKSHERKLPVKGGKHMQSVYLMLPSGSQGKSMAMAVESRVIAALRERGFALISDHDARRHSAPPLRSRPPDQAWSSP